MSASGFLNSVCRKTKLCKYFVRGRCTRQPCNFAHSIEELLPVPNLSCTKVCPTLLHSGQCNDSSCTFAHRRNELRKLPPEVSTRAPRAAEVDGASTPGPATRGFSRQVTPGELLLFEGPPGKQATGPLRQTTAPAAFPEPRGSAKGCAAEEEPAPWAWSRRPGPEGRNNKWSPKFHKTSLCIFHERGKCKRGPGCQFAHGSRELHPAPNLSRTKLCPRLLASGFCSGEDCRYAHNKEELRKLSSWSIGLDDETEDVATHPPDGEVLSPDLLCEPVPEPTHKAPHHPAPVSQPATVFDSPTHVEVRVKNTFLTVDEPSDIAPQYVKRTQSMPQLWALSCSSPAADADNETCSWPIEEEEVEEVQGADDMGSPESCEQHWSFVEAEGEEALECRVRRCDSEPPWMSNWSGDWSDIRHSGQAGDAQGDNPDLFVMQHEGGVWIHVKNTFLSIDEPQEVQLPRRCRTSPNLLAAAGDGNEDKQALATVATVSTALRETLQDSLLPMAPEKFVAGWPHGFSQNVDFQASDSEPDTFGVWDSDGRSFPVRAGHIREASAMPG